jgi:hypothetical protein
MKQKGLVRMGDIAECFEIVRCAATVLTLNRSEEDQLGERMRVLLDKQRDGRTNIVEICKTDMSRIAIYGPQSEGLGFMTPDQYIQATATESQPTEAKNNGNGEHQHQASS